MLGKSTQEIAINHQDWQVANTMTQLLVEEGYVVMVSIEGSLIIINYVNPDGLDADRNGVVFMSASEYDEIGYDNPDY